MRPKKLSALIYASLLLIILFGCASTKQESKGATPAIQAAAPVPTPYYGPKKRIAIIKFENKVKNPSGDQSWEIGDGLAEMLTTELFNSGRFILVERAAFADVVKEQELGQIGLVQQATAAKTGQALGAQILVMGAVTEFKYDAEGGSGGISFSGLNLGLSGKNAHVAIDLRMIDANTGQVIEAHRAVGKASSTGLALSTQIKGVTFGGDSFKKTPIGQAARQAIDDAIRFILQKSEPIPWSGAVVKVEGDKVFINAGANSNVKAGDILTVFSKGENLVDPSTGLVLGATIKPVGEARIELVEDQFSVAHVTVGTGMKRGDVVKYK
jgi:curli biogenesis system outer membrane secretion channel CsgG